MKLYDTRHPYYCNEGCYCSNDCHLEVPSWDAFKQDTKGWFALCRERRAKGLGDPVRGEDGYWGGMFNADDDYNLLYRWDWFEPEPGDIGEGEEPYCELKLFYMLQRKARPLSVAVRVTREDEPEIRVWLEKKWHHIQRVWTPFAPDIEASASADERAERTMLHYGGDAKLSARVTPGRRLRARP